MIIALRNIMPTLWYIIICLYTKITVNLRLAVYNLFDRLNENSVNDGTGRAYTAVIKETDLAGHRSDFNEYEDRGKIHQCFQPHAWSSYLWGLIFRCPNIYMYS